MKKVISMLLLVCMVFTMLPLTVGATNEKIELSVTTDQVKSIKTGDSVTVTVAVTGFSGSLSALGFNLNFDNTYFTIEETDAVFPTGMTDLGLVTENQDEGNIAYSAGGLYDITSVAAGTILTATFVAAKNVDKDLAFTVTDDGTSFNNLVSKISVSGDLSETVVATIDNDVNIIINGGNALNLDYNTYYNATNTNPVKIPFALVDEEGQDVTAKFYEGATFTLSNNGSVVNAQYYTVTVADSGATLAVQDQRIKEGSFTISFTNGDYSASASSSLSYERVSEDNLIPNGTFDSAIAEGDVTVFGDEIGGATVVYDAEGKFVGVRNITAEHSGYVGLQFNYENLTLTPGKYQFSFSARSADPNGWGRILQGYMTLGTDRIITWNENTYAASVPGRDISVATTWTRAAYTFEVTEPTEFTKFWVYGNNVYDETYMRNDRLPFDIDDICLVKVEEYDYIATPISLVANGGNDYVADYDTYYSALYHDFTYTVLDAQGDDVTAELFDGATFYYLFDGITNVTSSVTTTLENGVIKASVADKSIREGTFTLYFTNGDYKANTTCNIIYNRLSENNLIVNGDFDSAPTAGKIDLYGNNAGSATVKYVAATEAEDAYIKIDNVGSTDKNIGIVYNTDITLMPGTYQFSFSARHAGEKARRALRSYITLNGTEYGITFNENCPAAFVTGTDINVGNVWYRGAYYITVEETTVLNKILIRGYGAVNDITGDNEPFDIDDLCLVYLGKCEASVDGVLYETVGEAVLAATSSSTVTLHDDINYIDVSKGFTLNVNDKNVTNGLRYTDVNDIKLMNLGDNTVTLNGEPVEFEPAGVDTLLTVKIVEEETDYVIDGYNNVTDAIAGAVAGNTNVKFTDASEDVTDALADITVPVSVLAQLAESAVKGLEVNYKVNGKDAKIVLDAASLDAIATKAADFDSSANVVIAINQTVDTVVTTTYDITITAVNASGVTEEISSLNGSATVTVPFAGTTPAVYYVAEDGTKEAISGATFNETTKLVTFTTTHFSTYSVEETAQLIVASGAALLYDDFIQIKYVFTVNTTDAVEMGALIFASSEYAATHDFEKADEKHLMLKSGSTYYVESDGIPAKEMGDSQFVVGYVKFEDGSCYFAPTVEYSPRIYARRMVDKSTTAATTKALCNALMYYGAMAQSYMDGITTGLMNEGFDEVVYDESVLGESIFSVDTALTNGFKARGATLLFEGAITYKIQYSATGITDKTLYAEYTTKGVTKSVELVKEGSYYYAYVKGIAAKDMDEAVVVKPYYFDDSGSKVYGAELVYSGYEYSRRTIANSTNANSINLAKAFAMYVDAANTAIK